MNYDLVFRGSATKDALEAFFWYHTIKPELGDRSMAALRECYGSIESNPLGYQVRKGNFRHVLLHKFPYRVVYEVEGQDGVHLSRLPHQPQAQQEIRTLKPRQASEQDSPET